MEITANKYQVAKFSLGIQSLSRRASSIVDTFTISADSTTKKTHRAGAGQAPGPRGTPTSIKIRNNYNTRYGWKGDHPAKENISK